MSVIQESINIIIIIIIVILTLAIWNYNCLKIILKKNWCLWQELPFFREKNDFKENLEQHRQRLHHSNTTVYREIDFYTDMLQIFIDWLYESVGNSQGHGSWQILVAYQLLIVSNVDTGIERTLGERWRRERLMYNFENCGGSVFVTSVVAEREWTLWE